MKDRNKFYDASNFKYKIQVELAGAQQPMVGYKIEDGHLVVGQASKDNVAYIENVRLVFNGQYLCKLFASDFEGYDYYDITTGEFKNFEE